MYTGSASFYDALYHFKDYSAAAERVHQLLQRIMPSAKTLLDVGCGTGKHISELQKYYQMVGVDISDSMLEVAKLRSPDVCFHQADMAELELGLKFDVVMCLFSALAYVKTLDRLHQAMNRMASHLQPGGVLLIEPWIALDRYRVGAVSSHFYDGPEQKIAWMYVNAVDGLVSIFDIHYLVGTADGVVHFTERHEMGLFTHEEYVEAFENAGLEVELDPQGLFGRGLYIGIARG